MTTEEALKIANEVKSRHNPPVARADFNKLQGSRSSPVLTALEKRWWDGLIENVADMQKQLDRARAGVALCADVMNVNINTETMQ